LSPRSHTRTPVAQLASRGPCRYWCFSPQGLSGLCCSRIARWGPTSSSLFANEKACSLIAPPSVGRAIADARSLHRLLCPGLLARAWRAWNPPSSSLFVNEKRVHSSLLRASGLASTPVPRLTGSRMAARWNPPSSSLAEEEHLCELLLPRDGARFADARSMQRLLCPGSLLALYVIARCRSPHLRDRDA
jgi:hypothetical protein